MTIGIICHSEDDATSGSCKRWTGDGRQN